MSAAIKVAKVCLDTTKADYDKSRHIVHIMKEGRLAALLEDGYTPPST